MSKHRTRAIQLALVAFTAILIVLILPLIGSIHDIDFLSGRDLELGRMTFASGQEPETTTWMLVALIMRILLAVGVALLVIQLIVSREARRMYIVFILVLASVLMAIDFLGCGDRRISEESVTLEPEDLWERPAEEELNLQSVEREVRASNLQYIILAIILSSIIVIVGSIFLLKWLKARPQAIDEGLDKILDSITDAAHRLRAGEDPYTVVLFCYQEMIRILSTEGKIDATYLTPREFELRLRRVGLSGDSIAQLTGIFEIVRYGGRVDASFAARALACLDAIQEAHTIDEQ